MKAHPPATSPRKPTEWLLESARRLPIMNYGIGIVGVAAVAALSIGFFFGRWMPALFSGVAALIGMILLRTYAATQPKKEDISVALPAQILIWTGVLSFVVVTLLGLVKLGLILFPSARASDFPTGRHAALFGIPELLDKTYGPTSTQESAFALRDVRAHLSAFSENPLPITGDPASTRTRVLQGHSSLFFQGDEWILKAQGYALPRDAKTISAVAVADDPGRDLRIQTRLFARAKDGLFRRIPAVRIDGRDVYPVTGLDEVTIFSLYPGARMFVEKSGTEQIIIEIDDLCGEARNVEVAVGGKVRDCTFKSVFGIVPSSRGSMAYEIPAIHSETVPAMDIVDRFRSAAQAALAERPEWSAFHTYWQIIQNAAQEEAPFFRLTLDSIRNDLFIHANGTYSKSD